VSELPQGWDITTFGSICGTGQYGWTTKSSNQGDVKYLRTTDITKGQIKWDSVPYCQEAPDDLSKYQIQENDILISRAGSVGFSVLIDQAPFLTVFASYLIRFVPLEKINPHYVAYFLRSPEYWQQISEASAGIALANVNAKKLTELSVPLSPLNEQHRIVAKLDTLFTRSRRAREELERIPKLIQRYKQAMLAAACSGCLTADWREQNPNVESALLLLNQIQEEKQQKYEKECNKAIAEGLRKPKQPIFSNVESYEIDTWSLTSLETIASAIVDCPHSTPKWTDSGFLCIRTTQFEPFNLKMDDVKYVDKDTFNERISRLKPQAGDVVYSREGGILGIACQISQDLELCLGQRMMLIRCNSHWLSGEYLTILLNSEIILSQVKKLITGTASPHLNVGDVKAFKIPVPPLAEQNEIVQRVEKLFKSINLMEQEYQKASGLCNRLEQATLSKAFRGELVPQNPDDEPASVLLERMLAEKDGQPTAKRGRTKKRA
jgi:type I restriction enzyme S subunit